MLGFDQLSQYETQSPYFGCTVGRVAFRIARGEFVLDGKSYQLTLNDGAHHLHGGVKGFSHVVWQAAPLPNSLAPAVRFTYRSPDGDQGYPGTGEETRGRDRRIHFREIASMERTASGALIALTGGDTMRLGWGRRG